jgi:hypothetical protein
LRWRRWIVAHYLGANLDRSAAGKWWFARDAFVKQAAKREEITACIHLDAHRLLRRKIHRRADNDPFLGLSIQKGLTLRVSGRQLFKFELFSQTKVEHLDLTTLIDHHV